MLQCPSSFAAVPFQMQRPSSFAAVPFQMQFQSSLTMGEHLNFLTGVSDKAHLTDKNSTHTPGEEHVLLRLA
jgi:hypothetical protein